MPDTREAPPSFEEVIDKLSPPLRRYLERMTGDPMDADDLLQIVLIKIAKGLSGFEGRSKLKTWAFQIAYRTAVDHFRRKGTRGNVVEFEEEAHPVEERETVEQIVIDEMSSCVREVIDSLPPDYRSAIVLHDLQKLTAEETAQACGCSLATAKIRIHRARKRLRKALQDQCTFYNDENQVLRCDRKDATDR